MLGKLIVYAVKDWTFRYNFPGRFTNRLVAGAVDDSRVVGKDICIIQKLIKLGLVSLPSVDLPYRSFAVSINVFYRGDTISPQQKNQIITQI